MPRKARVKFEGAAYHVLDHGDLRGVAGRDNVAASFRRFSRHERSEE